MRSTFIRHLLIQLLSKTENVATINPKPSENLIHSLPSNQPIIRSLIKTSKRKTVSRAMISLRSISSEKEANQGIFRLVKRPTWTEVSPRLIKKPPRVFHQGFSPTILDSLLGLLKFADARHDTTLSRQWLNRRNKRKRKRKRKQRAKKTSRNEFLVV